MTGDVTVHGAGIHASTAADAAEHGAEFMSQNVGTSVVHDHDMHILWAVGFAFSTASRIDGERAGDLGANRAAHQKLHHYIKGAQVGHDALGAHDNNLSFRDARSHTCVALVGNKSAGARFRNAEVAAGYANGGVHEFGA